MSREIKIKSKITSLSVKDSDTGWQLILRSREELMDVSPFYIANIIVDQSIFDERKEEVNARIREVEKNPDMFDNGKTEIKNLNKEIRDLDLEFDEFEKLQIPDFKAKVLEAKFVKRTLTLQVTDDVVANIIKIRNNFNYFVVALK